MAVYLCKLLAPRATFPGDMTPDEGALMQQHGAYWQGVAARGQAIVVGPVFDPAGAWGMAVVDVADADAAAALTAADPIAKAGAGFRYEIYPVPQAILRDGPAPV